LIPSINVFFFHQIKYRRIDPNDDVLRALFLSSEKKLWEKGKVDGGKAVKGSSMAAVYWVDANGQRHLSIFYQDPKLRLREISYDYSKNIWVSGEVRFLRCVQFINHPPNCIGDFNPGVQPRGTPIFAEAVRGGDVEMNVIWRDAHGRAVSGSWSKLSGWDLSNRPMNGTEILDKPARSVYILLFDIKHLKQRSSPRDRLPRFTGSVDHPLTLLMSEICKVPYKGYKADNSRLPS